MYRSHNDQTHWPWSKWGQRSWWGQRSNEVKCTAHGPNEMKGHVQVNVRSYMGQNEVKGHVKVNSHVKVKYTDHRWPHATTTLDQTVPLLTFNPPPPATCHHLYKLQTVYHVYGRGRGSRVEKPDHGQGHNVGTITPPNNFELRCTKLCVVHSSLKGIASRR